MLELLKYFVENGAKTSVDFGAYKGSSKLHAAVSVAI